LRCSAWAALAYPRLFSALTLVDPPIMPFGTRSRPNNPSVLVDGAVARRDTWASRYVFPPHSPMNDLFKKT
jgi:hypothetical protein